MQDIKYSIMEYEESRGLVKKRIHELNAMMSKCKSDKSDSSVKSLIDRRTTLYTELWDIEFSLRSLRDYLSADGDLEVDKKVG